MQFIHPRFRLLAVDVDAFSHLEPCAAAGSRARMALWGHRRGDVTYVVSAAGTGEVLGGVHIGRARRPGADAEGWFWIREDRSNRVELERELAGAVHAWAAELSPGGDVRWLGCERDWQEWAASA